MTLLGTIRKNYRELPAEFLVAKGRKEASSLFGSQESTTIVSYCQKRLNAFIIWLELNPDWKKKTTYRRREFLLELGTSLLQKNRSQRTKVPPPPPPPPPPPLPPPLSAQVQSGAKRGRCHLCERSVDRKHPEKSARRAVPHSIDVKVAVFTTLPELSSSDVEQLHDVESNIHDSEYEANISTPQQFSEEQLSYLIRDFSLSKQASELLASRIKEINCLKQETNITAYRTREKRLLPYFNGDDETVSFPGVSCEKLKAGIFDGPQIRKLINDSDFSKVMTDIETSAWCSFVSVVRNF
ncbi:hypothetical protein ANN_22662 [Periplaneta americana]|uniref:Uncharacterized protein n=1 Tax=Periplaneta americana TaxID=6978 RepID=A0ABQ8S9M1_PERAM|nr:hypothetical protein ANN_22662 [Periplaneta americana]